MNNASHSTRKRSRLSRDLHQLKMYLLIEDEEIVDTKQIFEFDIIKNAKTVNCTVCE